MAMRRPVYFLASVLLLATQTMLATAIPARADGPSCSLQDLGNDAQNTYNGFVNGQCGGALDDPVAAALTLYLTTLVGGMGSQSASFCQMVSDVSNWTNNAQQNINNASSALNKADPSGQLAKQFDGAINSVSGALTDAAGIESAFTCACSVTASLGQLFGDLGSCVQAGLCDFANAVHSVIPGIQGCSGPPDVTWVNCMQSPCSGSGLSYNCNGPGGLMPMDCGSVPCTTGNGSVQCQPAGDGQICGIVIGGNDSGGANIVACSCPAPRQITQHTGVDGSGDSWPYFTCDCPAGTSAAGVGCLCDTTHLPPQPVGVVTVINPEGAACPPPFLGTPCPSGQINLGGKCITPCSNPADGMTQDGTCCNPSQVTSCGMCCPPGTTPDPSNGTCIPKQIAQ
jgi:hypothetical protein